MPSRRTILAAFNLVGLTWLLLVFGSTVRVHGAGLACPDWPLCFGEVVPAYDFKVYLEFGHRVVAGFVSLGFLGLWAHLWRSGAVKASRSLRVLLPVAAVVLLTQIVLGGLTVLELLAEWTVSSHLLTGNTFCTTLLLVALATRELTRTEARTEVSAAQRAVVVALALLVPTQLVLGGLVSSSHAGLACGTWPSCNGSGWFPTLSGPVGLQVVHRITAYTLAAVALVNLAVQWRTPELRRGAVVLVGLVTVQVLVGIANVMLRLPMEVTLLHSATAALIFLTTGWQAFGVFAAPLTRSVAVHGGAPAHAEAA